MLNTEPLFSKNPYILPSQILLSPSPMASSRQTHLLLALSILALCSLIPPAQSQLCSSEKFRNSTVYSHCNELSVLKSSLHFTYDQANSTLSLAFVAAPAEQEGWIAWAINPTGTGMVGAQSLIAFRDSGGKMVVKAYNITSKAPIKESPVWFKVVDSGAEFYGADGVMRLFATVVLPEKAGTSLNHVWQVGSSVTNGVPDIHNFKPENLNAKGTLDLLSGLSKTGSSGTKKKNIHGILNAVSWGILLPIGVIIARYLRVAESADPAWFYLHAFCQSSGYAIGVAGWAIGLKLGSESKGVVYSAHRKIGIALFSVATVQMFALFLRPKKEHKLRFYWNIYHHALGYAIVSLSIVNVFKGLDILSPGKKWKNAYIIVLIVLGAIALLLEAITWVVVVFRKKSKNESTKPYDESKNVVEGQG